MSHFNSSILSWLIFFPLLGAAAVLVLPRKLSREVALAVGLLNFLFSLHLFFHWDQDAGASNFQFEQIVNWLPLLGIKYHVGVDGVSVFLVMLTTFMIPLVILGSWNAMQHRAKEYVVLVLLLETAIVGVFCALDMILFYICYEAVLIPMYILIVGWGGARRGAAAIKFFIYTMAGSVLMWVAILYIYFQEPPLGRSFDLAAFKTVTSQIGPGDPAGTWLFLAFVVAFAIKAPLFPLHSWLPEAYTEAPMGATVILAALLSKMGAYGFIRFAFYLFPTVARSFAPLLIVLAIVGIIYGALVALRQTNLKRLIAYSSISHLGFVLLGIFCGMSLNSINNDVALTGATIQMVNHGITTGALFLLIGFLYERRGTYEQDQFGGLAETMPRYSVLFWIALFASIGLPGLNGFVGEYLILQGAMSDGFWYAAGGALGVILGAIYMLRMYRSVMHGEVTREENRFVPDMNRRETVVLAALLAVAVWIGVAPKPFLQIIGADAQRISGANPMINAEANLNLANPKTAIAQDAAGAMSRTG